MLFMQGMRGRSWSKRVTPEALVLDLHRRLKRHTLWDGLFRYLPPLMALLYLAFSLFSLTWITVESSLFLAASVLGLTLGLVFHQCTKTALADRAAWLIDGRVEGKERFVTLSTIDPADHPAFMVDRLREEATRLMARVHINRDFPYRFKKGFLASAIGSIILIIVFHLSLRTTLFSLTQGEPDEGLAGLARQISQIPRLSNLGRDLGVLAVRERELPDKKRKALSDKLLEAIENQLAAEGLREQEESEILKRAAAILRHGKGRGGKNRSGRKGSETNQSGKGAGKRNELTEGEKGAESGALSSHSGRGDRDGKPEQGGTGILGMSSKGPKRGEKDSQSQNTPLGEGTKSGVGAQARIQKKGSQDMGGMERGKTPERYRKPGAEGGKGIQGARFVIVELPEGEGSPTVSSRSGTRKKSSRTEVPIGGIDLPKPSWPGAAGEEQHMPLEYQELIR